MCVLLNNLFTYTYGSEILLNIDGRFVLYASDYLKRKLTSVYDTFVLFLTVCELLEFWGCSVIIGIAMRVK